MVATFATGVLSVLAAAPIAFAMARRWIPYLVSYAVGVLLGAAFLDLLPEAAESLAADSVLATALAGIFVFFMLEKLTLWHHAHPTPDSTMPSQRIQPAGPMILIGGGLHNFTDGVLLAAAFLTDVHLGLVTTAAVVAHEIPREMGDFAVLLDSGFSWRRALFWNVAFSVAAIGRRRARILRAIGRPTRDPVRGCACGRKLHLHRDCRSSPRLASAHGDSIGSRAVIGDRVAAPRAWRSPSHIWLELRFGCVEPRFAVP